MPFSSGWTDCCQVIELRLRSIPFCPGRTMEFVVSFNRQTLKIVDMIVEVVTVFVMNVVTWRYSPVMKRPNNPVQQLS